LKTPESIAAKLAIGLLDERSKHPMKAAFQWPSGGRIEKLADRILDQDELPVEPHMAYAIHMIIGHFETSPNNRRMPTAEEVIAWIKERGGIPGLVLAYLARMSSTGA
jgi:hypothetical protein